MAITGTARDHLTPLAGYPNVRDSATLRDVFASLQAASGAAEQFRNVLVLDDHERLVGTLGLRDLLYALLPDYLHQTPERYEGGGIDLASLAPLWQEDCSEQCRKAAAMPAGAHARKIAATLAPDDPLTKAVFLFAATGANILPVVEDKRLLGVLRLVDVFAEVTKAVLHE
jgi:CBS domain-containing protein